MTARDADGITVATVYPTDSRFQSVFVHAAFLSIKSSSLPVPSITTTLTMGKLCRGALPNQIPNRSRLDDSLGWMIRRDAAGLFGKLQPPFDQLGDRVTRQTWIVLPDGFCVALPSAPLCSPGGGA